MAYRAVGLDLGNTLVYRPGIPLSWIQFYPSVLAQVAAACACQPEAAAMVDAEAILRRYNTRLHPRVNEVSADTIFAEILRVWGVRQDEYLHTAIGTFFRFFLRQDAVLYDDVLPALHRIRASLLPIGILSDTAYGMPTEYYASDLALLGGQIDVVLTSVDIGFRKPAAAGYLELARRLNVDPTEMVYIGDEEKDIVGAQAVGIFAIYLNRTDSKDTFCADCVMTSLDELHTVLALPPGE